jgi:4-amino-4-deoxy-L-arabinose transferase-like glycosyltransferase
LAIPLALSAFTHLWNPIGFPYGPSNDEGIYRRRTMNLLEGQGPLESFLYDHPYFAQLFLAGVLKIVGYPDLLHPSSNGDILHPIEMLWLVPRVLTGLLAVVDTFLVYKIAERRYNRTIALIASILFAVTPTTWIIRRVWLESIQLPFLLCSILFAIYSKKNSSEDKDEEQKKEKDKQQNKNKQHILLVVLSGIFLGLAIFTKIPAFTIIPLVGFLMYTNNNKDLKVLGLWFIPVILIPLIWPAYAAYINEFNLWLNGIYFETHRETQALFEAIDYDFRIDSTLISLGIIGLVFAAIKKIFFLYYGQSHFLLFSILQDLFRIGT